MCSKSKMIICQNNNYFSLAFKKMSLSTGTTFFETQTIALIAKKPASAKKAMSNVTFGCEMSNT